MDAPLLETYATLLTDLGLLSRVTYLYLSSSPSLTTTSGQTVKVTVPSKAYFKCLNLLLSDSYIDWMAEHSPEILQSICERVRGAKRRSSVNTLATKLRSSLAQF